MDFGSLPATLTINACWKHIGIGGDRSCPELDSQVHCRNCPRYSDAAALLRDHFQLPDEQQSVVLPSARTIPADSAQRHLIFRIEKQWFALPSRYLNEVTAPLPVRMVPFRHSTTLLGVCHVRGQLIPCVSLHRLFGLADAEPAQQQRRMLVLQQQSGPLVTAVDQIQAIELLPASCWAPPGRHSGSLQGQLSLAVSTFGNISLTLLDADALLQRMLKELQ